MRHCFATSLAIGFLAIGFLTQISLADISYTGGSYSQDFDSLATSGTGNAWANDTTILGWHLFRVTSSSDPTPVALSTYNAGNGGGTGSTTGTIWSYGSTGSTERALGGLGSGGTYWGSPSSGGVAGWMAVSFNNGTGSTLGSVTIGFDGEQWRDAGNGTPVAQTMVLQYGFGATFSSVGTWTNVGGNFDWSSPVFTTTAGAVDGNVAGLVAGRGGTISGLTWLNGQTLFIRWIENNDSGNDHGLAIDNFSFSASQIPEPSSLAIISATCLFGAATFRRRRKLDS